MTPKRVVVTGAGGFVGTHLMRRLVEAGHEVLGIVRSPGRAPVSGVRLVVRDLGTTRTVQDLLQPGDTVVHLAARAHVMHDRAADPLTVYRAANVAPTRMLCESATAAGATRLIFVSSAKVYGEGRHAAYGRDEPVRPVDPYALSKAEAEEIVRQVGVESALEWTILRPPFVYGPGGRGNFPRLVQLARVAARIPLPFGAIRNARSVIYVGNLADAIHRCIVHPAARGAVFLPTDPRDISTPELIHAIAQAMGRRAWLFPFPVTLLRMAAAALGRGAEMDRLTESLQLDGSALQRELQWVAPYSLEEGIRLSLGQPHASAVAVPANA